MKKAFLIAAALLFLPVLCVFAGKAQPLADNLTVSQPNLSEKDYFPHKVVTGPKAWGVACSALLVEYNWGWHDSLTTRPRALVGQLKETLKESWDIENNADLMRNLYWLESRGHRASFQKLGREIQKLSFDEFAKMLKNTTDKDRFNELQVAREYYPKLGKKSLVGWDFARAIFLCRTGYECGYISENEAWYRIMNYAQYLQQTFDSWEDLGRNYIIGRKFWSYQRTQASGGDFEDAFKILTETPSSPWKKLDWNMDLLNDEASDDK
jgi:hypothetical protein